MRDYINQLCELHPGASADALEFHSHIIDGMERWSAPTGFALDFVLSEPTEPGLSSQSECSHRRAIDVYGMFYVQGVLRCSQCIAECFLWLPSVVGGLLVDPSAVFEAEYIHGSVLSILKRQAKRQTNDRLDGTIEDLEVCIDDLGDPRIESAYRYGVDCDG